MTLRIEVDHERIADFCRRKHVARLCFFGSVTSDRFSNASDVDVLVEFEADAGVGLFEFVDMRDELTTILGRDVDLHTPASLSHFFRDCVLASAEVAYAA